MTYGSVPADKGMNNRPERILIATSNTGKFREYSDLLSGIPIPFIGLANLPPLPEPDETGSSFSENAALKAARYAVLTGEWTMADDSGLEVNVLNGAPGIHSARFGGYGSDYRTKNELLLDLIARQESDDRKARFVCSIAVAGPDGVIVMEAQGECRGVIAESPRGINGFGYDPIFIPDGFEQTFAELRSEEKREISHRARASSEIIGKMLDFMGV